MKRKTNLFYTVGSDSNFITFSNYTESLTGAFLSVDHKLFPSSFMCLYAPALDNDEAKRTEFIEHLTKHYENKLAFLRDELAKTGPIEDKMLPGHWLLECIYKFFNNNVSLNYIGQVTEQDYNGTFTDTIMVIDSTAWNCANVDFKQETDTIKDVKYDYSTSYLYNWYITDKSGKEISVGPEDAHTSPIFDSTKDGVNYYSWDTTINALNVHSSASKLDYVQLTVIDNGVADESFNGRMFWIAANTELSSSSLTKLYNTYEDAMNDNPVAGIRVRNIIKIEGNEYSFESCNETGDVTYSSDGKVKLNEMPSDSIKFNMVIPMYDLTQMNPNYSTSLNDNSEYIMTSVKNVPLGIWLSGEDHVFLNRRNNPYAPSWALSLSSQFKPFPYSKSQVTEIDQTAKDEAFMTYAQIIVKHNEIINKMNDINANILGLSNRISILESKVNTIGSESNIDELKSDIASMSNYIKVLESKMNL